MADRKPTSHLNDDEANSESPLDESSRTKDDSKDDEDEDEDDYMSMALPPSPRAKAPETYSQRRQRLAREAEARGRVKSKAEREADEIAAREVALSTSLLADKDAAMHNRGLKMMARMGFKEGQVLGKQGGNGRAEPLVVEVREGKGGIGLEGERKRVLREEGERLEREGKKLKADEGDFRERIRSEREESRLEAITRSAMMVAERMDAELDEQEKDREAIAGKDSATGKGIKRSISTRPLKQINVLWRGLVRDREEKERDRRMRYDLGQSATRLSNYIDATEDADDRLAMGNTQMLHSHVEDLEEEDPELDAFKALPPGERLRQLVAHLRTQYRYCFWCKYTYPTDDMDGCAGLTEEDHE